MTDLMVAMSRRAKHASWALQKISEDDRNKALEFVREELSEARDDIFAANKIDLENAKIAVDEGKLSSSLFKRLDIRGAEDKKFKDLLQGVSDVANLPDPLGKISLGTELNEGLELFRVSCPVGVICIIFEARPEVVVQIASLCLKSGNAVILKGGKEASKSNEVLVKVFREGLRKHTGLPIDLLQLVETREEVASLLKMDKYIDMIIPRGSKSLVTYIQGNTRIPVLGHSDGICSVYLDNFAEVETAIDVVVDSKTNYTAACNALETLLVHRDVLETILPRVGEALINAGVEIRADKVCLPYITGAKPAVETDFDTEFLDLIIAVKCVNDMNEAIEHINIHGSHHTDCIITENKEKAEDFMQFVDSAGVYHNASTRFADGFRYGFGAEIGVSTNKTHARGPVGLEGLLIYKYKLYGAGQTVSKTSSYKHRNML